MYKTDGVAMRDLSAERERLADARRYWEQKDSAPIMTRSKVRRTQAMLESVDALQRNLAERAARVWTEEDEELASRRLTRHFATKTLAENLETATEWVKKRPRPDTYDEEGEDCDSDCDSEPEYDTGMTKRCPNRCVHCSRDQHRCFILPTTHAIVFSDSDKDTTSETAPEGCTALYVLMVSHFNPEKFVETLKVQSKAMPAMDSMCLDFSNYNWRSSEGHGTDAGEDAVDLVVETAVGDVLPKLTSVFIDVGASSTSSFRHFTRTRKGRHEPGPSPTGRYPFRREDTLFFTAGHTSNFIRRGIF